MKMRFLMAAIACLLLAACTNPFKMSQYEQSMHQQTSIAMAESASSISQSLTGLGATEQAAYPPESVSEPPSPASYGMAMPASIDWNGPIQKLAQQVANATNYQLRVLGKAPSIPIIVSISAKNTPTGNILRDAGYQAGKRANIVVFPSTRTIELRYAKQ